MCFTKNGLEKRCSKESLPVSVPPTFRRPAAGLESVHSLYSLLTCLSLSSIISVCAESKVCSSRSFWTVSGTIQPAFIHLHHSHDTLKEAERYYFLMVSSVMEHLCQIAYQPVLFLEAWNSLTMVIRFWFSCCLILAQTGNPASNLATCWVRVRAVSRWNKCSYTTM